MCMPQRRMPVQVAVRLSEIDGHVVRMMVMFVMYMAMLVHKLSVLVFMLMVFAEMQPNTKSH